MNMKEILSAAAGAFALAACAATCPPPEFVTEEDSFEDARAHGHVQGIAISEDAVYCGLYNKVMKFSLADGRVEQLRAGFGEFRFGAFQLTDRASHPTAASAAWREGKLVIEAFILNGIYRSIYTVDFTAGAAEPIRRQDICTCFRRAWTPLTVR